MICGAVRPLLAMIVGLTNLGSLAGLLMHVTNDPVALVIAAIISLSAFPPGEIKAVIGP
jgi:hypothetical protein